MNETEDTCVPLALTKYVLHHGRAEHVSMPASVVETRNCWLCLWLFVRVLVGHEKPRRNAFNETQRPISFCTTFSPKMRLVLLRLDVFPFAVTTHVITMMCESVWQHFWRDVTQRALWKQNSGQSAAIHEGVTRAITLQKYASNQSEVITTLP